MGWLLVWICFVIAMAGAIFPIIPGVLFLILGYMVYGWFYGFEALGTSFWVVQLIFTVILFLIDWWLSVWMIRKYGGSKRAEWGGAIGLFVGPWVTLGMMVGTFLGSMLAEWTQHRNLRKAFKVGLASLLGFLLSTIVKVVLQAIMIVHFLIVVL
jgi:uncharacterized protein